MIVSHQPRIDLTYCLNAHPGQTWSDHRGAIERFAVPVGTRVAGPEGKFGLGLWLTDGAARDLGTGEMAREAAEFFAKRRLYPFTVNGTPCRMFHGGAVKEKVFLPDWQSDSRREHTVRLARLLAGWLPDGCSGSINTLPGSYKPWINREAEANAIVERLLDTVVELDRILSETGKEIHLGLEPEPDGYLDTTREAIAFFEGRILPFGVERVAEKTGRKREASEEMIRRHLGVCFDTGHLAVQFEDLVESWSRLERAGIRISKVQLSNVLEVRAAPECWEKLEPFVERVYLHQVKGRGDGRRGVVGWPDLPAALMSLPKAGKGLEVLRVRYPVPLHFEGGDGLETTAAATLTPEFFDLLRTGGSPHLEIENYTYDVLPEGIRPPSQLDSLVEEFRWVMERFGGNQ